MILKKIVLCGSSKFEKDFERINRELTLSGNVVYSLGFFGHSRDKEKLKQLQAEGVWEETKKMLDLIHQEKILASDTVFIINVNGYIGKSTRNEISFAEKHNKEIVYLFDI